MKKLIIIFLVLVSNAYSQSSFTQEWESPADKMFIAVSQWESNNSIPEIVFQSPDENTIYVYDGGTKQLKYTYSNPYHVYHFLPENSIKNYYTPIDVNNDGIFEIVYYYNSSSPISTTIFVINGSDGSILFQNTYNGFAGSVMDMIDIDGDGYTEIIYSLIGSKILIISTTSNYVGINNINSGVDNYKLKQNYPNPFNPNTKIEYTLSKSADIRLVVYDISGKEITTLVNEKQNAGTYIKDLNGAGLSSGTYFYQLIVNGIQETKKNGFG